MGTEFCKVKSVLEHKAGQADDIVFVTLFIFILYVFIYLFLLFRASPEAYGGSQARGQIGAVAAGLHRSHSNARSELSL